LAAAPRWFATPELSAAREISMKHTVLLGILLVVAVGCASSDSADADLEAWTREVRVIEPFQIGERQYEEVASLEEREPINSMGEDSAISRAREQLRRRAAKLDADALVLVDCGSHVRSVEPNSSPRLGPEVVCHGVAIRWTGN
jgi:hypothetical protein